MLKSVFKTYHPIVNFTYFVIVIVFACFFMHPVCLAISFISAFSYSIVLKGRDAIKSNLIYMLPMLVFMALLNPAFNHEGMSILTYLPSGNPVTFESVIYGLSSAGMIVSVICWFSCYNQVMTSDKFIYLFGRIIPSLSLIFSMTLRFVPRFKAQLKVVTNAQKCMGRDMSNGNVIKRAKHGLNILSVMTTWALENSVDTADSMKARGYGISGRTSFSIFKFDKRDLRALLTILILAIYVISGTVMGGIYVQFFPSIKTEETTLFSISILVAYFMLCIYPIILELWEVRKWKALK